MARPRSSADPHGRKLGDAEPRGDAVTLLPARPTWRPDTRAAYRAYGRSAAVKALRDEDVWQARRLFDMLDMLDGLMEPTADRGIDLMDVGRCARMATEYAKALGIGPAARLSLGIKTETAPGSRLDAFRNA